MSCIIPSAPFDLTVTLNTAPSIPFQILDDTLEPPEPLASPGLAGATIWFSVKVTPNDADSAALIFASTILGNIVITDAALCKGQIDLTSLETAETSELLPECTYPAFFKIQLPSGETRVRSGWMTTFASGIEAP